MSIGHLLVEESVYCTIDPHPSGAATVINAEELQRRAGLID